MNSFLLSPFFLPLTEIVQTADQKDALTNGLKLTSGATGSTGESGQMRPKSGVEAFDVSTINGGAKALGAV